MADIEGTHGEYVGPVSGATPASDSDLHSNPNPFAAGSPASNLNNPSTFPQGRQGSGDNLLASDTAAQTPYDVVTPYYRNPVASGGNPYALTSAPTKSEAGDRDASASVAAGLSATYDHLLPEQLSGAASPYFGNASQTNPSPPPSPSGEYFHRIRVDEGVDEQVIPLSERK